MLYMRRRMLTVGKLLVVIPFVLATSPLALFQTEKQEGELGSTLWYSIFGRITAGEITSVILAIKIIGVMFLFALLFGTWLSRHFEENSHMTFTRIFRRGSWGGKRILEIWGLAAVYTGLYLGVEFILSANGLASWQLDGATAEVLLMLFGILFPAIALTCLGVNWIGIHRGVTVGVLLAFAALLVLEGAAVAGFDSRVMMVFNPFCANARILELPMAAVYKCGVNLAYLALMYSGMVLDIRHMDIF